MQSRPEIGSPWDLPIAAGSYIERFWVTRPIYIIICSLFSIVRPPSDHEIEVHHLFRGSLPFGLSGSSPLRYDLQLSCSNFCLIICFRTLLWAVRHVFTIPCLREEGTEEQDHFLFSLFAIYFIGRHPCYWYPSYSNWRSKQEWTHPLF